MTIRIRLLIMLGLVVAAVAVPLAQAGNSDSYIGHPGGPGGVGPVPMLNSSGSYIGHPGGPGGVGPVLADSTRSMGDGFDWADAVIGGGFVAGIALAGIGVALMMRRRRPLAEQQT
jgi:hypothetical protein